MPLVEPLPADHDAEIAELAEFFNITLGFSPNSVLTMMRRAKVTATRNIGRHGWRKGKHT